MASNDGFTPEDVAEQWIFDFYFNKCLTEFNQEKEMSKNSRKILQMLMEQSIDVEYKSNRLKANLLIVVTYQLQLEELHLVNFPWPRNFSLIQSKEMVSELLNLVKNLRNSLSFLESSEELQSSSIHTQCRSCLLHTDVFMLQVLDQLRGARDELFEASQVESWMKKTLRHIEKKVEEGQAKEKKILQICKGIFNSESEAWKILPQPEEFCNVLSDLLTKISKGVFARPEMLQFAECYLRVQSKLEEEGNGDLFSHGPSSVSNLEKLARLSRGFSANGDQPNEHTRVQKKRSRPNKIHSRSRSRSSSMGKAGHRSRSGSTSSSSSRNNSDHNNSKSRRVTSSMSRVAEKLKQPDQVKRVRPLPKHLKKPASHARVNLGKWTPPEEENFVVSVLKFGPGNWQNVKEDIKSARSTMQLKDKWRNIPKSRVKSIAREHGLSMPP